jgi:carboxypeptidase Taq
MTIDEARTALSTLQKSLHAYTHAAGLLYYDGVTGGPSGGAQERGETLAFLSGEMYKLSTGAQTGELLDLLDAHKQELTPAEARQTELMRKQLRELRRIPLDEYVAYQQLCSESSAVWHTAKTQNDWQAWKPYLTKIVATLRRFASLVEPDKDPYDYCLDQYEEGLTQRTCDRFFAALKEKIVPLIGRVKDAGQVPYDFMLAEVPVAKQTELSRWLMGLIGMDPAYSTIATTEHPFTTNFSKHDVRITTHYYEHDFAASMFSVIHEGGHALYELHVGDELQGTVLAEGCSMAVHESQSRFYENILGRSRAFIGFIYPKLAELSPALAAHTPEEVYKAINRAEPSLIRTEADELTYCLHIVVRYELEKALMHGELEVKDLPARWNSLYKEYLGVDVPDDRHGVLQDSHWSDGGIGYFPSYALGSAYGAQLLERMKRDVDVDACLAAGNFAPINDWETEHIWKYGRLYKPDELVQMALGERFDPAFYTDYLEKKFSDIYGL